MHSNKIKIPKFLIERMYAHVLLLSSLNSAITVLVIELVTKNKVMENDLQLLKMVKLHKNNVRRAT